MAGRALLASCGLRLLRARAGVAAARTLGTSVTQVRLPAAAAELPPQATSLAFPCIERQEERALDGGPEPVYDKVVSGYQRFVADAPFAFELGGVIDGLTIAYETWGTLNPQRTNAVLIHTGLSASSHARSHRDNPAPGWWERFVGPGLAIDTDRFFVICTNVIGSCYGSSGPSSVNTATGKPYGTTFPVLTVFDMVRAQFLLLDSLGVRKLHASVGSSLGGMQSLAAAALFPDRVARVVSISAAARSIPYSIAMRYTQRRVLMSDPNWNKGDYYDGQFPFVGMKLAREIATISYRSGPEWEQRFGRKRVTSGTPSFCPDFLIETYLDNQRARWVSGPNQGEKFCLRYDPNSLLYISKAMDLFDLSVPAQPQSGHAGPDRSSGHVSSTAPACERPTATIAAMLEEAATQSSLAPSPIHLPANEALDLQAGMARIKAPALIIGVQSDLLFPCWQQREVANCLRKAGNRIVRYYELDALYGHDTFLIDVDNVGSAIRGHLDDDLRDAGVPPAV